MSGYDAVMRTPLGQELPEVKKYGTKPDTLGMRPGFDAAKLNQLADALETDAFLKRENPLKQRRPQAPSP